MLNGKFLRHRVEIFQSTKSSGFAYVLLLIFISVIGIFASASLSIGSQIARRDAEQYLLFTGAEFEQAIRSYAAVPANATNAVNARGPRTLEELLKDTRSPSPRRHLRQIYADPMTGKDSWGIVREPGGTIVGVYSLAEGSPIKKTGFPAQQVAFEDAETYSAWIFGLPNLQIQSSGTIR